ncbi:UNVERIFIED_CONTAM: toprim domain-containing protein, partial [Kocuria sp. CPCC 205274]
MSKKYGNKVLLGDSTCPECRKGGGDKTGNHLQHWKNEENGEEWTHCNRCGHGEKITDANRADIESVRQIKRELTDEEREAILAEANELPIMELKSRGISRIVAERFGVRVGLSGANREPISHFYPKHKEGQIVAYKIRNLDPKGFYAIGSGSGCDFFGEQQAIMGDVWGMRLHVFEDELSCMSGYQALTSNSKGTLKPACVSLPDGAGSAASVFARRRAFVERFEEIYICMDNDDAGEKAVSDIRAMYPKIRVARIPKGTAKDGKAIKDANDLLMDGRSLELNNLLRFNAAKESPT